MMADLPYLCRLHKYGRSSHIDGYRPVLRAHPLIQGYSVIAYHGFFGGEKGAKATENAPFSQFSRLFMQHIFSIYAAYDEYVIFRRISQIREHSFVHIAQNDDFV